MDFSPHMDNLLKPFIKSLGKCKKREKSKKDLKIYESVLISLYNDIYLENTTIFNKGCLQSKVINLSIESDKKNANSPYMNVRYFPEHIKKYIKDNEAYQLIFTCKNIGGREIVIHFTLFSKDDLENLEKYVNYVKMMYIWLSICTKYDDNNCTRILNIFIYLTPFTKKLPLTSSGIIGPDHVNTAYTTACTKNGEMVIFREEEWFKVFVHETFHAYGLDFSTNSFNNIKEKLREIFPINSDFDIYETYTETWARIINCAFCSFNSLKNKKDKESFIMNINFCLDIERLFSIYQCVKILGFMGIEYKKLYNNKTHQERETNRILYKENTHVFSYYILTSVFLNDYIGFMNWCKNNNNSLLKFDSTSKKFESFLKYILSTYNCMHLLKGITYMNKLTQSMHDSKKVNNYKDLLKKTIMSILNMI